MTEHIPSGSQWIREIVSYKLALVGLAGLTDYYPSEISGGMQNVRGWRVQWLWIQRFCSLTNHRAGWIRSVPNSLDD